MYDTKYVTLRERLIPEAEAYADQVAGTRGNTKREVEEWAAKWNKAFHTMMDKLSKERGLING